MSATEKATHTPGPWESKQESAYVPAQVWADGRQLAEVYGEDRATRAANARLIAAAPELLEALEALLIGHEEGATPSEWFEQARAAIRKAKGGA